MEAVSGPREKWPVAVLLGVAVAWNGSQGHGVRVQRCDMSQKKAGLGLCSVDVTPVFSQEEVVKARNVARPTKGGVGSAGSFRFGQRNGDKKGGIEVQFFGDCWAKAVMRRKYMEITEDFQRELKR